MNSFEYPFNENSLFNSRPRNPVLGNFMIPPTCNPRGSEQRTIGVVTEGSLSSGIFKAVAGDPPVTVYKAAGTYGVSDLDLADYRSQITIPRWPANAVPASGDDGHCDVIDVVDNIIHSLWGAKKDANGRWTAKAYAWCPLKGSGMPDPAHYYQGARAAGVPTCAGMIRKHETLAKDDIFYHALVCSLDCSGLAADPAYIAPAMSSDVKPMANTGQIPEGALLMLPPGYDLNRLNNWPNLRKVARTLKEFGMYVMDRNDMVPFAIYVEAGSNWPMAANMNDPDYIKEMDFIRTQLRQVVSSDGHWAGTGQVRVPPVFDNILSMRGDWATGNGFMTPATEVYDSYNQRVSLPATTAEQSWKTSTQNAFKVKEYRPVVGEYYKISLSGEGNATYRFTLESNAGVTFDSWYKPIGSEIYIKWPASSWYVTMIRKQAGPAGWIKAKMVKITKAEYLAATGNT